VSELPLDGIRVVDFGQAFHGDHVPQWLAVLGAEVIKIESHLHPDLNRSLFRLGTERTGFNQSVENAVLNYGKKSITLNMTLPEGLKLAREIIKLSNVVTDNRGSTVMKRWGLDYPNLKKLKPELIVYSGSGYGQTGPFKDLPAYGPVIEAFCGVDTLTGYAGGPPVIASYGTADLIAALHGVFAILAALEHCSRTGEGQYIDLSMSEANTVFLAEAVMDYTMNRRLPERMGNRDKLMAPHGCYKCRGEDSWVAIAVSSEDEWAALCRVMGNPDWAKDDKFGNMQERWENQDELDKLIEEWTVNYTPYEVMEMLQRANVAAGASLSIEQLAADPHLKERGFLVDIDHPEMGRLRLPRLPWRLSDCPAGNYEHPPLLGEHNDYVFGELLGLSTDEITRLEEAKVIY
jgi:benzylsuccinate CoA-transferase BbsF subunit